MIFFRDFQNIYIGLALIVIYIFLFAIQIYKSKHLLNIISADRKMYAGRGPAMKSASFILVLFSLIFLTMALMRPQTKSAVKKVKTKTSYVVFALDTSASMLTRDVQPNRLTAAKNFIRSIVSQFSGEKAGLLVFSGAALIQCPFTDDYTTFLNLLDFSENRNIPVPGTNIASAINRAAEYVSRKFVDESVMILLSDGESFDGDISAAIEKAKKQNIHIYTIGVGTPAGEPVPVVDAKGGVTGYKKDKYGNVVVSKLDSEELKKIAAATGGRYFEVKAGSTDEIRLLNAINRMQKSVNEEVKKYEYEEQYHIFVLLAFAFLLIDLFLPLFFRHKQFLLLFLIFLVGAGNIKTGNKYYNSKQYYKALKEYYLVLRSDTHNVTAAYNLGNALYRTDQPETAAKIYGSIRTKDKKKEAEALYNAGDAYFKAKQYGKAVENYVKSLVLNPSDTEAKYNLEVALRKVKPGKGKSKRSKKNKKQKQKQNSQKKALKKMLDNYDKKQKLQKKQPAKRKNVENDW